MDSWTEGDRSGTPTARQAFEVFRTAPVASWIDLTRGKAVLIVAPHADDETLGCGGLIAQTARRGVPIHVAVLTDGARSHPNSRTHPAEALSALREGEVRAALDRLGAQNASLTFFHQPDGYLGEDGSSAQGVVEKLAGLIDANGIETIFVTWGDDPHPDHAAAYKIVERVGSERPTMALFAYPIWGLTLDDDMPVETPFRSALRFEIRPVKSLKHAAIECFQSQLGQIIHDDPDAFSLKPEDIERFCSDFETFVDLRREGDMRAFITSVPTEHFDSLYLKDSDPWKYIENQYEQDRFQKTIAALPQRSFRRACEIGCSIGVLTEKLADRAGELIGVDCSEPALAQARERLAALGHVTVERMRVPEEVPRGSFDLIVFSEVLYFFSDPDLGRLVRFVEERLEAGGICLMVNFLGDTESPQSGNEAAQKFMALSSSTLRPVSTQEFEGFRIDVLGKVG